MRVQMMCESAGCRAYNVMEVERGQLNPLAAASVKFDRHLCRGMFAPGGLGQRAYNSCIRAGYSSTTDLVRDWHMALPDEWPKGCGTKSRLEIDRVVWEAKR